MVHGKKKGEHVQIPTQEGGGGRSSLDKIKTDCHKMLP